MKSQGAFSEGGYFLFRRKALPLHNLCYFTECKNKNRAEFSEMLQKALSVNIQKRPSLKLQNTIYQQRAKWLLANIDKFFPVPDNTLSAKEENVNGEDK